MGWNIPVQNLMPSEILRNMFTIEFSNWVVTLVVQWVMVVNGDLKDRHKVISLPTEGYAVSFPPGGAGSSPIYGHVVFVEKVYSDNSILFSEMNVKGNNIVSERHISAGVATLATYVQPK